jgi:hypothetical protein
VSLQAFQDDGDGAVPVGDNVRVSEFTWERGELGPMVELVADGLAAGRERKMV